MSTKRVLLLRPFPESPPPEAGAQWTLEAVGSLPWISVDGMETCLSALGPFPQAAPTVSPGAGGRVLPEAHWVALD